MQELVEAYLDGHISVEEYENLVSRLATPILDEDAIRADERTKVFNHIYCFVLQYTTANTPIRMHLREILSAAKSELDN